MHESATPSTPSVGTALGEPEQLAYKVPHAAKLLDMGERKVWALVHSGQIESFTIGTARRVTRQAILDYIQRRGSAA
jgi:excisionase family DNA binding protein